MRIRRIASAAAAKKWPRLLPVLDPFDVNQPDVSLMDKCGRLQRLARSLPLHLGRRQPSQLVIDEREQSLRGNAVTTFDLLENRRDILHSSNLRFRLPPLQSRKAQKRSPDRRTAETAVCPGSRDGRPAISLFLCWGQRPSFLFLSPTYVRRRGIGFLKVPELFLEIHRVRCRTSRKTPMGNHRRRG